MNIKTLFIVLISLSYFGAFGQYQFSGKVNKEYDNGTIYLSLVDDYRKVSGVFPEQIFDKTKADSLGNFNFSGNKLAKDNKLYRIHIDNCTEEEQQSSHFTGHCNDSKEIVFIANNSTQIELPFSFENEMFCRVLSKNESANALLKLDSLKNDMKYAFGTYRSEANRKLNSKKWFEKLQQFGADMNEPLVELYAFSFLSERSSSLHSYYLEDIRTNPYYDDLLQRLQTKYPNSYYTSQYEAELEADTVFASAMKKDAIPWQQSLLIIVVIISLLINLYYFRKKRNKPVPQTKASLSNQEEKVLALILDNKTNKEIASLLFVSVSTVKTHINNIYKKLNVSSRDEVKKLYLK